MAARELPAQSLRLAFRDASCLPGVRRWLRAHVRDEERQMDAELVATELVTNAVDHGGGAGSMRITITTDEAVHIEVDDRAATAALPVGRSRFSAYRGRGLTMVAAVAAWGVTRTATTKTVWATVRAGAADYSPMLVLARLSCPAVRP